MFWMKISKTFPNRLSKNGYGSAFLLNMLRLVKVQHSLTPALNRPDILIDSSGSLLVRSDLLLSKVDDYGWGLESVNK
jgi:hypothetical protein